MGGRRGGAPRSESEIFMIASGNHSIISVSPPYKLVVCSLPDKLKFEKGV
jgi:hypothetical protein